MDDFGAGLRAKAAFPGWNKGGSRDHFAGGVDDADVFEDRVGDCVFGGVGHSVINALIAGISKC